MLVSEIKLLIFCLLDLLTSEAEFVILTVGGSDSLVGVDYARRVLENIAGTVEFSVCR